MYPSKKLATPRESLSVRRLDLFVEIHKPTIVMHTESADRRVASAPQMCGVPFAKTLYYRGNHRLVGRVEGELQG